VRFGFEKVERSKLERRKRMASLPFAEKLRILDALRERDQALRASRQAKGPRTAPEADAGT